MNYTYNCKYRPAVPGSVPTRGLVSIDYDTIIDNGYGTVTYNRELTKEEVSDYELELVNFS